MENKDKISRVIFTTVNDNRVLLIRIIVGLIFLTEGIQKFLMADACNHRFLAICP